MEQYRGERDQKSSKKEDIAKKFWVTPDEQYPDVDERFRYWSKGTSREGEELQHRWEIRQSLAGKQPSVEELSEAREERTVKPGAKIVFERLRRVREFINLIKPRQPK